MDRYAKGLKEMEAYFGKYADEHIDALDEIAPLFAKIKVEWAWCDIFSKENSCFDRKTNALMVIAALTVAGHCQHQLQTLIMGALHVGATKEEIVEVITNMTLYCGFPVATNALMTAKNVFDGNLKGF